MLLRNLILSGALGLAACATSGAPPAAPACPFPEDDAAWFEPALHDWAVAMERDLGQPVGELPRIYILGDQCIWLTGPDAADAAPDAAREVDQVTFRGRALPIYGALHGGTVHTPDDSDVAPGPVAFSSASPDGEVFFIIANAALWRTIIPVEDTLDIGEFLRGVVAHELVHTQQPVVMARLTALAENMDGNLNDESQQGRFAENADYVAALTAEKATLIAAIREPDIAVRRRMAGEIAAAYRARQTRFLTDDYELHRDLENNFLTMEGVAVWLNFQVAPPEPSRGGSSEDIADFYESRDLRGSWVQMQGGLYAALLETIDPSWRRAVFAPDWRLLPDLMADGAEPD